MAKDRTLAFGHRRWADWAHRKDQADPKLVCSLQISPQAAPVQTRTMCRLRYPPSFCPHPRHHLRACFHGAICRPNLPSWGRFARSSQWEV